MRRSRTQVAHQSRGIARRHLLGDFLFRYNPAHIHCVLDRIPLESDKKCCLIFWFGGSLCANFQSPGAQCLIFSLSCLARLEGETPGLGLGRASLLNGACAPDIHGSGDFLSGRSNGRRLAHGLRKNVDGNLIDVLARVHAFIGYG